LFWWESPDGSRVLALNTIGYGGNVPPWTPEQTIKEANVMRSKDFPLIYGVGDHGGGPTRADVVHAHAFAGRTVLPRIKFSSAHNFFTKVKDQKNLPVVKKEINFEFNSSILSDSCNILGEPLKVGLLKGQVFYFVPIESGKLVVKDAVGVS
jgi:alpha-mannosidase